MSSPDGGFTATTYALAAGVPTRLWAAENDPDGCTIINGDSAAVVYLGNQAVQASLAGGGQMLGPLQSVVRRQGQLYAVSAAACLVQVVEGETNYAQIGTPQRQTDNETASFNTYPGASFYPMQSASSSRASGANKLFWTMTRDYTGVSVNITLSAFYTALGYSVTLANMNLAANGATSQSITPTDVSLLVNQPYQLQLSANGYNANVNWTGTVLLVPE